MKCKLAQGLECPFDNGGQSDCAARCRSFPSYISHLEQNMKYAINGLREIAKLAGDEFARATAERVLCLIGEDKEPTRK